MYCSHCGSQLDAGARFCASCGMPAESDAPVQETGTPVLTLEPVFVPLNVYLKILPLHVFFTLWGGGFLGGMAMFGLRALGIHVPTFVPFAGFAALFFVGVPLVGLSIVRRTYARTVYRFYATKLEYHEGFFAVEKKSIDYRKVTEVSYRQGVLQKRHGLATIVLSTAGLTVVSGRVRSGILVQDVPGGERVYHQVRELVERASRRAA